MSNVAKLKKKAAELELKKDFAKALAVYVELLDNFDQNAAELDVSLFNRVGDLMLRQGSVADAVDYYERAVVRYVDGGFYNNAIALCNKILRHSPGRASVYYILGKISAHKGFTTDAKQNFLEYADRMQKAGNMDEAFRALKEFADLCPGQDDIRIMLSEQLSKLDRKDEAIEQLQLLWARFTSEGRTAEAEATVKRMKAIDPSAEPRADASQRAAGKGDLVFLDLDDLPAARAAQPATARKPSKAPPPSAVADLPLLDSGEDDEEEEPTPQRKPAAPAPSRPAPSAQRPARVADPPVLEQPPESAEEPAGASAPLPGLEPTNLGGETASPPPETLDFEPTSFEEAPPPPPPPPPRPAGPPLIEPEASSTLLAEGEVIDGGSSGSTFDDGFGVSHGFDLNGADSLGISRDNSGSLHIDLPPGEGLSSGSGLWQSSESPFGDDSLDSVPPLLRSDAFGLDSPGAATESPAGGDGDLPLIDFDTSSLDGPGMDSVGNGSQPPPSFRRSTASAERSAEMLRADVDGDPENWLLRRELAEKMLESGDKDGGIRELESAMMGAERANELDLASSIAEEIARIAPDTVRFHQKRVEYAFRTNDKLRLIEAYLALAGALLGSQQVEKARAVYQRVLDLAPDDIRAQAALESLALVESTPVEAPAEPPKKGARKASMPTSQSPVRTRGADPLPMPGEGGFVNLGDLLRDDGPKSTRMIVDEEEPTGDEEADFADMLKKFKQGIAENVDKEDYQSHYDLGVAFKEMGLLDEAIGEFQKALRAPSNRLPTYEAIGLCFIEKEQYAIAATVLARALNDEGYSDESLVGVLYLLGRAAEALHRKEEALSYYQRVFVVDIEFRDIVQRIRGLERAAR